MLIDLLMVLAPFLPPTITVEIHFPSGLLLVGLVALYLWRRRPQRK